MKSLMFLFLATLGMIELGVMGSHNHCPAARPHATYGAVRHIALATPPRARA